MTREADVAQDDGFPGLERYLDGEVARVEAALERANNRLAVSEKGR